jgi:PAS domain S-box-containing protein
MVGRNRCDDVRGSVGSRWRGHAVTALGCLAVLLVVLVAARSVLGLAGRQTALQDARVAMVQVSDAVASPRLVLVDNEVGTAVSLDEYALSATLRGRLTGYAANLVQVWPTPTARTLNGQITAYDSTIRAIMNLISANRFIDARTMDATVLQPAEDRLTAALGTASANLTDRVEAAERSLRIQVLRIIAGSGAIVLVIMIGMVRLLRRRDRQRAEATMLRDSEQRFRALVQNSSDLTLVCDTDGKLSYVSPAALPILGWTDAQLRGQTYADLLHPDDAAAHRSRLAAWKGGFPELVRVRMRRADGSYRLMEANLTDMTDDPSIAGVVGNLRDVTDRTRLEGELLHARKLEAVGQLASGIAHEINTPIQYIGDNVRFLSDAFAELSTADPSRPLAGAELEYLLAEIPQAITQTLDGVRRVSTIVAAMKTFGHPGSEKKTLTDINQAVRTTFTVANNVVAQVADVVLDLGEVPEVSCHPGDINQALLNLVINAAHAIAAKNGDRPGRGTLTVRTAVVADQVQIQVSDTGTGVPDEIGGRLFDPFFTTKAVGHGTGQGLAIAHALITERHGGSLTFDSTIGTGTTFTIRLPIADTEPAGDLDPARSAAVAA